MTFKFIIPQVDGGCSSAVRAETCRQPLEFPRLTNIKTGTCLWLCFYTFCFKARGATTDAIWRNPAAYSTTSGDTYRKLVVANQYLLCKAVICSITRTGIHSTVTWTILASSVFAYSSPQTYERLPGYLQSLVSISAMVCTWWLSEGKNWKSEHFALLLSRPEMYCLLHASMMPFTAIQLRPRAYARGQVFLPHASMPYVNHPLSLATPIFRIIQLWSLL